MDIEFHYHMTCLIAARAGLPPEETRIVAYSSQYVDDNSIIFEIDKDMPTAYSNYISQTMNILKPKAKLFRIYPIFHFIPGDPMAESAWRKAGEMHWLNTTPDSENANRVMDAALTSGNLYRIGIACHGYADTWAHQNFILSKLAKFVDPGITKKELKKREATLKKDLDNCIGEQDQTNEYAEERIARYSNLATEPEYGKAEITQYDEDRWLEQAVNEKVRGLRDRSDLFLTRWDPLTDIYTWKDRENYKQTHWLRFQEAVKQHQDETWGILKESNLKGLELPEM